MLTDQKGCLPLLEKNVSLNLHHLPPHSLLEPAVLDWSDRRALKDLETRRGPFNLVLVSDCVYYEASLVPLSETLAELGAPVLLSFEVRESEDKRRVQEKFFELVGRDFDIREFSTDECHPDYASPDIKVLRLEPRRGGGGVESQ